MALLYVVGLYIAAIIGAGFASGQEIMVFFVQYGQAGFWGILMAVFFFTSGVALVLFYCRRYNIGSYLQLFEGLGKGSAKYMDWIYTFFLLVGTSVMFAGSRGMGTTLGGQLVLGLGTPVLVLLVLQRGVRRVLGISGPLALVIIFVLAILAATNLQGNSSPLPTGRSWQGLEAALLYASYNLGFAMALFTSIQHYLTKPWHIWFVSLLGNLILGILLTALYLAMSTLPPQALAVPFPLHLLAVRLGPVFSRCYRLVLWLAMYTTALANSLGIVKRITSSDNYSWANASIAAVGTSFLFSFFGFQTLINWAYPLLGLAGLWIFANLLVRYFNTSKRL